MNSFLFNAIKEYYKTGKIIKPTEEYDPDSIETILPYIWYNIVSDEAFSWHGKITKELHNYDFSKDSPITHGYMWLCFDREYLGTFDDTYDELAHDFIDIFFGESTCPHEEGENSFNCSMKVRLRKRKEDSESILSDTDTLYIDRDVKTVKDFNDFIDEMCDAFADYEIAEEYIAKLESLKMED